MFSSALRSFVSNITSNYAIDTNCSFTSGPWNVHNAKKKSTGKPASVFIFDRKSLEPNAGSFGGRTAAISLKKAHEEVVERLKKEAGSLARLRHPNILELAEPVEETRNGGLMFATESVTASLGSVLRDQDYEEKYGSAGRVDYSDNKPASSGNAQKSKSYEIDELEIQKGLLQIAKGLEFLHESAGLVHGNFGPESVFINAKSDWKISGLAFASPPEGSNIPTAVNPLSLFEILNFDARLPRSVQLDLDYSSPDFVIDSKVAVKADMFSLGLLIVAIYSSPHRSPVNVSNSITAYKKLFSTPSNIPMQSNTFLSSKPLPQQICSNVLPHLLTRKANERTSAKELQQSSYFDNVLVSAIKFLETFPTKSMSEKKQYLRGLPRIINQFPTKVLERKILPGLMDEVKDRNLLSLILQNSLKICENLPPDSSAFAEAVLPRLRTIFFNTGTAKAYPDRNETSNEAGIVMILENLSEVSKKCSGKQFKDDILPIVYLGLESNTNGIVDLALRRLTVVLDKLDYATSTNEVFPVIAAVFKKTSSMGIKIRGLEALRIFCGNGPDNDVAGSAKSNGVHMGNKGLILDKYTVQEKVMPLLKAIKTKEPTIMMAALPVFRQIGVIADAGFVAMDVLPIIWAFALGPLLDLKQFKSYIALIKELSAKIEEEQIRKLRETSSDSQNAESSNFDEVFSLPRESTPNVLGDSCHEIEDDFANLVLGRPSFKTYSVTSTGDTSGAAKSFLSPMPQQSCANAGFSTSVNNTNNLEAQNATQLGSSRSITPDFGMNKFAPLQPAAPFASSTITSQSPIIQLLQPSNSDISSMSNPNQPVNNSSFSSNKSSSNLQTQLTNSLNTIPSQSNLSNQNGLHHSYPSNPSNLNNSNISTMSQSTKPYNSFSIPPPASGLKNSSLNSGNALQGAGMNNVSFPTSLINKQKQQMQQEYKQGMEKFESLL